jgi:hypothetical protein
MVLESQPESRIHHHIPPPLRSVIPSQKLFPCHPRNPCAEGIPAFFQPPCNAPAVAFVIEMILLLNPAWQRTRLPT